MPQLPDPAVLDRPWVASYPPGVPPTYDLPKVVLGRFLDDAARDFGDRPALVTEGEVVDNGTLRDRVEATATVLTEQGVASGDRVLVVLPSHATTPIVLFALWRIGAVAVPLPVGLPVDRLAAVTADAEVAAVVGDRATLQAMAGQQELLPPIAITVDGREWRGSRRRVRLPRRRRAEAERDSSPDLGALLRELGERRSVPTGPVPDDLALLAYLPYTEEARGVALTHANLVANAFQARLWIPDVQAGTERLLVAEPLHEPPAIVLGILTGLLAAATVIVMDEPDPGELAYAIDREQPTLLVAGAGRLRGLANDAPSRRDLTSLRVCLSVGTTVDAEVAAELERRTAGARVRECFGRPEAGALTHAQPVYGRADPDSLGLPVTDTVAIVVDPEDRATPCPPGEPGLLLVSGPQVFSGYWARPEADAGRLVDGWLVTGDLATVTADGVFRHVGRLDEVLRREGTLVAPRDIEAVLERHPDVGRAGVVVLDGPSLVAAVTRRRRHRVGLDELMAHCRVHLEPAALPDRVEIVDEVPVTADGEIARDQLRRQLLGR